MTVICRSAWGSIFCNLLLKFKSVFKSIHKDRMHGEMLLCKWINTNTKVDPAHLLLNSSTSIFNAIFNQRETVSKRGALFFILYYFFVVVFLLVWKHNESIYIYIYIYIYIWSAHYFTSCIKDANPPRSRRMFDIIWSIIYCLWSINSFSVTVKKVFEVQIPLVTGAHKKTLIWAVSQKNRKPELVSIGLWCT